MLCRKVTSLVPDHARAYKLLGGAHYALSNFELAKFELEKAILLDPQYADAYCDLGEQSHTTPLCCGNALLTKRESHHNR